MPPRTSLVDLRFQKNVTVPKLVFLISVELVSNLPQTQQRLFERIQQKQKEAISDKVPDATGGKPDQGGPKDDNWYSSDEEQKSQAKVDKPRRKKRWDVQGPEGPEEKPSLDPPMVVTNPGLMNPVVLPKELTDVLSAIKKDPMATTSPVEKPPVESKPVSRDPR